MAPIGRTRHGAPIGGRETVVLIVCGVHGLQRDDALLKGHTVGTTLAPITYPPAKEETPELDIEEDLATSVLFPMTFPFTKNDGP